MSNAEAQRQPEEAGARTNPVVGDDAPAVPVVTVGGSVDEDLFLHPHEPMGKLPPPTTRLFANEKPLSGDDLSWTGKISKR
jgi:hypothetical protein